MKVLILILLPLSLIGQINIDSFYYYNPLSILNQFKSKYVPYDIYANTGSNPCPWQTFRSAGTQSIAINIVCDRQELDVLIADKARLVKDLWLMWNEAPPESLETVMRGNRVFLHRPGQQIPMIAYYNILRTVDFINVPNGLYEGWQVYLADGGLMGQGGKVPMALKEVSPIDGKRTYILSIALIMKARYISLDEIIKIEGIFKQLNEKQKRSSEY